MSVTELQDRRNQRAANQAADYSFRLVNVSGYAVVYVTSHKPGKDGACPVYTVHSDGRCNCPDYQHRCSQVEGLKCKHGLMVEQWLADCDTPELPEPAAAPAQVCAGCGEDKPGRLCLTCGSSSVVAPSPDPEKAAREARKRDLLALWP